MDEALLLATRNIKALNEGMKHFEAKRVEDSRRVEQLMSTVTQLTTQMHLLSQQVNVLRAKSMGTGSTGGA